MGNFCFRLTQFRILLLIIFYLTIRNTIDKNCLMTQLSQSDKQNHTVHNIIYKFSLTIANWNVYTPWWFVRHDYFHHISPYCTVDCLQNIVTIQWTIFPVFLLTDLCNKCIRLGFSCHTMIQDCFSAVSQQHRDWSSIAPALWILPDSPLTDPALVSGCGHTRHVHLPVSLLY